MFSFVLAAFRSSSSKNRVNLFLPPALLLSPFFHSDQLVLPIPLKCPRPFMQRPARRRIRPVKLLPSIAPHMHQPNILQYAQMLRNGRLLHLQSIHNLSHRPLLQRQIVEYLSPPRLSNSVESIGGRSSPRHERHNIFQYGNMSSFIFFRARKQSANLTCKMQVNIATLKLCKKRKRRPSAVPDVP